MSNKKITVEPTAVELLMDAYSHLEGLTLENTILVYQEGSHRTVVPGIHILCNSEAPFFIGHDVLLELADEADELKKPENERQHKEETAVNFVNQYNDDCEGMRVDLGFAFSPDGAAYGVNVEIPREMPVFIDAQTLRQLATETIEEANHYLRTVNR